MSSGSAIARLLRRFGLLRVDLLVRTASRVPVDSEIWAGELVLVEAGRVKKWACLQCPGGCGQKIALSLNPQRRPRWNLRRDWLGRPHVEPSVHQINACGCHFWIRRGRIEWCTDGYPRRQVHGDAVDRDAP